MEDNDNFWRRVSKQDPRLLSRKHWLEIEYEKERERKTTEERERKAEEERFQQTLVEKYYEFRLGIPGLTDEKFSKWKKMNDGVGSKGTRENSVVGLEKTGVRTPLIKTWVDGAYHMDELRRLNRIKFHEDDNRLAYILVICHLYEDLRAKNLSLEYAVSSHSEVTYLNLSLPGGKFKKVNVDELKTEFRNTLSDAGKKRIEIICGGVSNKKMTERWYNICYELNKIDKLVVGEKSILPAILSPSQFSLGEFEILYQKIISLDQQTDETLQLLRKILEEEIDGEDIVNFERWGILEEKYHDSLLRILDGENADIVLDEAGLLN